MHQPPTIPEGDEENEVDQLGEGARFPQKGASKKAQVTHDTVATVAESETHEDATSAEQPPTSEHEPTVEGEPAPTTEQTEDNQQPSDEKTEAEGESKLDTTIETDGENEISKRTEEGEESAAEDAPKENDVKTSLPTLSESPTPHEGEQPMLTTDEQIKSDESTGPVQSLGEERRRSAKSARERSAKIQLDVPPVDISKLEEEELDTVPSEPEIRINREEIITRYQIAEAERDRLRGINIALQQRLADYLHKRKGTDDVQAVNQGERTVNDQQQRYQKYLSEIQILQERIKHDQAEYEKKRNEYEQQIQGKKDHVEELKTNYVKLVKEIASKAVFARSGKAMSNQDVEKYLSGLREKEEDLIKTRHENIRLKNQLKKRESQLKAKEELAEGLHMIDFEQLKIENQTYSEKIEERNEELMKLRKKISTTVQILSHIKEKLSFVNEQRLQAEETLAEKEKEVKQKRDELSKIKHDRDSLRQTNQGLKQRSGLIGNEQLLRDYEERFDDIDMYTHKLEALKKHHAEITLMCKVLKKKISKV